MKRRNTILIIIVTIIFIISFIFGGRFFLQQYREKALDKRLENLQKCKEVCLLQREVEPMECQVFDMVLTVEQYCLMYYDVDLNE